MEFASKYGYNYGHQGSDSEEISDEETETKQKVKRRIRKADSNVISVRFDHLVLPNEMFAGEPLKCAKCQAIMSSVSRANVKVDSENASHKTWECEFCYEKNDMSRLLSSGLDEVPKVSDVTFLIEQAPVKQNETATASTGEQSQVSQDDNLLSYCIDVSGSMDTLIQVKNTTSESTSFTDTNMTRLQGVKAACIENINHLKKNEPNKRVGLTTFSDAVKFYGDGTKCQDNQPLKTFGGHSGYGVFGGNVYGQPRMQQRLRNMLPQQYPIPPQQMSSIVIPPVPVEEENEAGLLDNKEKLMALATNMDANLKSIKDTSSNLEYRIKNLRTEGSTALGPALVFSIGFSSKRPGSQVILCTDGCANVGMGTIETGDIKKAEKFYEDLADQAKEKGVTVNVISMEGTDCKLALLGKVADRSNGTLSIVNPAKLGEQFKSILENRIVATNVKAKLIVNNKYLYIRDEELEAAEGKAIEKNDLAAKEALEATKKSVLEKDIGNANIDTEITFEYGVRKLPGHEATAEQTFKELPFQLQITYTTLDGAKAMRVYTKVQEFTKDRAEAEKSVASNELIFANMAQKMSRHVASNNVFMAKFNSRQMHYQQMANNWDSPSAYAGTAAVVGKLSKSTRMDELTDQDAEEIYKSKKASRSKMSHK